MIRDLEEFVEKFLKEIAPNRPKGLSKHPSLITPSSTIKENNKWIYFFRYHIFLGGGGGGDIFIIKIKSATLLLAKDIYLYYFELELK